MYSNDNVLVIGSNGQLGTELSLELQKIYGVDHVIKTDLYSPKDNSDNSGIFYQLDVLDKDNLGKIIRENRITQIYHLAAILSAKCEQKPKSSWNLNMNGLFNVLDSAIEYKISKVFWPSSIAVFGPDTPKKNTPQFTVINPVTVYGISKLSGENWCNYYHLKYHIDIRSIRYPGVIGYKSMPGGGTTDYAVEIFHKAALNEKYTCFLKKDTCLPMIYMADALKATLELMHAESNKITIRRSYNVSAFSFSPEEIYLKIKKYYPRFECEFKPDFRQEIAESWPHSIDDSIAKKEWNWKPDYNLDSMVADMINNISQ